MAEKLDFIQGKQAVTFIDLFAGAGGISVVKAWGNLNFIHIEMEVKQKCAKNV